MRIKSLIGGAVLTAAVMTSGPAFGHQTTGPDPQYEAVKCGRSVQVIGQGDTILYLDVRDVGGDLTTLGLDPLPGYEGEYSYNIWMYVESNGHEGMQTKAGSPHPVLGDVDESAVENCTTSGHTTIAPDTFVF